MEQSGGRILVVDDEPENIRLIGGLLTAQAYQVHIAESGERALAVVRELRPDVRLDLILLDILMPAGLDGIETCRRLKSWPETHNTPVIFLTGKEDQDTMLRAFAAGGADYVLKPFNPAVLLARVQTHARLGQLSSRLESALAERTRELRDANERLRQLALAISLIEAREKKRLATELHDSPMQKLALAQIQIASAARRRDPEAAERLDTGLELMREALEELRSLQFELSPPLLYREGLAPALDWLASYATRRFGFKVSCVASRPLPTLDRNLAVVLFQCARELVYNLAKHADASAGWIELDSVDHEIRLLVSDNGKGFRPADMPDQRSNKGGYGLFSLRERLLLFGGDLTIESGLAGTRAAVRIPLASGAQDLVGHDNRERLAAVSLSAHGLLMITTILLVDDHRLFRQGLAALLREQEEWRIVGEADDGAEAVRLAKALKPRIAVLDVEMPQMDGVEAARRIRQASPDTRIVALSMHGDAHYQARMFEAGAAAYVLKNEAIIDLVEAIQSALRGDRFVSPTMAQDQIVASGRHVKIDQQGLTDREWDVLRLLVEGRRMREIAAMLGISAKTVETYRGRLMLKLGVKNLPDLVKFAIRTGITSSGV